MKLIVHADDFGVSEAVNEGIIRAHQQGILTSASLMANGPAFDHAVELCHRVPSLDIGIHFTLVEERPLLDPQAVRSLLTPDGRFHPHATVFAGRYLRGKIVLPEVHAELLAQLTRVIGAGITLSHADSHQHTHALPRIMDIVVALAKAHDIPFVRLPAERPRPYMMRRFGAIPRLAQQAGLRLLSRMARRSDVRSTEHFVGFFYGGRLSGTALRDVLQALPNRGTCELMCHPGLDDPDSSYARWGYAWGEELSALTDPVALEYLRQRGIELVSFADLARGA